MTYHERVQSAIQAAIDVNPPNSLHEAASLLTALSFELASTSLCAAHVFGGPFPDDDQVGDLAVELAGIASKFIDKVKGGDRG